ncbi:MAG: hypothetical protein PQJ61_05690 [Spirochaetales bacterium]|uniref:Methyl-accepting transducer domain-containing protein n=1 Tax=Candidatus Thalassospirochaeta sargassi TaxID=3119039 RepID=A0AAJ1IBK5_9SPIO|nr:hypothetical protein [Spirochaetales bacterium]
MEPKNILQKVINNSEKIFAGIAENYPVLLSEFETGIDSASRSIESFSIVEDVSGGGEIKLDNFLLSCRQESNKSLSMLDKFKEQNEIVLNRLSAAMKEYHHSQKYIEEIRDISESLQIVSLNALCNAVKAGRGGEGFSVITGNLKSVTEQTIEKTSVLENLGSTVNNSLDDFFVNERSTDEKGKALFSEFEQKIMSGITGFQAESETIEKLFRELSAETGGIRKSILRIMEELQQQDLIRQSLDQVILSIDELPDSCNSCGEDSEDPVIDEIVFYKRLLDLAVLIIGDVEEKVGITINVFADNFLTARKKLEFIEAEKERAINSFINNLESFSTLIENGNNFRSETGVLSTERSSLIDLIEAIIRRVGEIVEEFASFEKISGWLQNVSVLSRIELSRSKSLSGMKESVDDMSMLVERIQMQISAGEKELLQFIGNISEISGEYRTFVEKELNFLNGFTNQFLKNITTISCANNKISNVLSTFVFFSSEFRGLFDDSEKDLDQLKEISEDLKRVREDLQQKEAGISRQLSELLDGKPVSDWTIADENMNRIINKFTIFSHKRTAGEVTGLNVEGAALEEGEITLF